VLRAMRRERSGTALSRLLEGIRRRVPNVVLRSSFIVGFPGEDEAAFSKLVEFVREEQFDRVGVFTYSREENTAAYDLPAQLPDRIKRERRAALMALQAEVSIKKNREMIGREVEVLVEGLTSGRSRRLRGRTAGQAPEIDGQIFLTGEAEAGDFVCARIENAKTYDLDGRITGMPN
jgi:ribosomal protein S12 methylthiotransferase